jgi:hypothetical protein
MRKSIAAPAAIAVVLLIGAPAKQAGAMPAPSPNQLGLGAGPVTNTVVVCGPWGCRWRPVWGGAVVTGGALPGGDGVVPGGAGAVPGGDGAVPGGDGAVLGGAGAAAGGKAGLRLHGAAECRDELRAGFREREPARREGMPV